MTIVHTHRNASIDEIAAEMDRRGTVIETLEAQVSELRAKLFPYADATEISGISWDGKYLIGDKASIQFFHEMKNRGEQIDVYKQAYDQNLAAKDAQIANLLEAAKGMTAAIGDWSRPTGANGMVPASENHPLCIAANQARTAIAKAEGRS